MPLATRPGPADLPGLGGNFLTSALALREIPPFLFTALRLALLALPLALLLKRPAPGQWPRLVAVALCIGVLHFGLSFWALKLAGDLVVAGDRDAELRADGGAAGVVAAGRALRLAHRRWRSR